MSDVRFKNQILLSFLNKNDFASQRLTNDNKSSKLLLKDYYISSSLIFKRQIFNDYVLLCTKSDSNANTQAAANEVFVGT